MVKKKKNKHNFWKRMHFKYRLSVMNENTLEEIWKIKASMFSGILLVLIFAFFLISVTSAIIIATPIRYYLPGYLDAEIRGEALRSAIRTDSLEQQLRYQEAYINNLRDVFEGKVQIDSVRVLDTVSIADNDPLLMMSKSEKEYNQKYEEEEKYNLSVLSSSSSTPTEGVVFYKPVKGAVMHKFDSVKNQFGVSVKIAQKETVLATLEGVVMSAGYDLRTGQTIQIQHKNGFISIYKYNTLLLKDIGDKVRTGEAIATIEGTKDGDKSETVFEFELWYKGNAVNPENYITF